MIVKRSPELSHGFVQTALGSTNNPGCQRKDQLFMLFDGRISPLTYSDEDWPIHRLHAQAEWTYDIDGSGESPKTADMSDGQQV